MWHIMDTDIYKKAISAELIGPNIYLEPKLATVTLLPVRIQVDWTSFFTKHKFSYCIENI